MRLYKKEGDTIKILSFPGEEVEKGEYLIIEDGESGRGLIVQVIDVQFANIPGVLEELLRNSAKELTYGEDIDPLGISSHVAYIEDARVLICKIRGAVEDGRLCVYRSWLPSRFKSIIRRLSINRLMFILGLPGELPIEVGEAYSSKFILNAKDLDGKLNIITGKKGTGKSHLSKLLVLSLVDYGAPVVVLDINGEYINLGFKKNGEKNEYYNKILILTPSENFKVNLAETSLKIMMDIMVYALELPGTSAREFQRIWVYLKSKNTISLAKLGEAIRSWKCNERVRDALFSRYYTLVNSGFFTDEENGFISFEEALKTISCGGVIVINLRNQSSTNRRIIVEYILGKLTSLLSSKKLKAIFLFAEEAHLYLRETYWDDLVTRMRHLGIFTTFITNQPDTIRDGIYRQVDNIFLFNFTSDRDLEVISRAARIDSETVRLIAKELPPHYCLVLGYVVKDFPVVVKIRELDVKTMGETRLFFTEVGASVYAS